MERVLVIDDEASQRSLIAATLQQNGFAVTEAADGDEGLRFAEAELPDVIISDVNMPGLDGFEVVQRLQAHARTASIPLILMTGAPQVNGMRRSMEKGADDYLPKPFDGPTLIAAVQTRLARKRSAERELREIQSQLLDVIGATPNFIAVVDAVTGKLAHLNPAARTLLDFSEGETESISLDDCFQGNDGTPISAHLQTARREGKWIGEGQLISRQGQRRIPVEMQLLAHPVSENQTRFSVIARDLTESLQLRQALKMEAIGRLAAGIAHEINTPTQYVGDNTRFLKESFERIQTVLDDYKEVLRAAEENRLTPETLAKAKKALADIDPEYLAAQIPSASAETLEGIGRIGQIVRAMKEFSHPGSTEKVPSDLNKAIESTATVARNEWKYVADLNLDLDPNLPSVPCLLGEINQAILNLIVNAAHAIGEVAKTKTLPSGKGVIAIQTRRDGGFAVVRVSDTGSGIPAEVQPRIFEPFFTTKEVGKGTGQGLAMVYSCVVNKHGGTVSFETEPGQGTTFILRLPLKPATASNMKPSP